MLCVALFSFLALAEEPAPSVHVVGFAEVKVVPDVVDIEVGVEMTTKDLNVGLGQHSGRVRDILARVRRYGVEERDIQTDRILIRPLYNVKGDRRTITGYFIRKDVSVSLRNLTQFEDLLTEFTSAGANTIGGIRFRVIDLRKHRDQAREMAIQAAREKAQAMAAKLGQKIGKALLIEELVDDNLRQPTANVLGLVNSMVSGPMHRSGAAAESPVAETGFAPGQVTVDARVKVRFALE